MGRYAFAAILLVLALAAFAAKVRADDSVVGKPDHVSNRKVEDARFAVMVVKEDETLYFRDIGEAFAWRAGECIATQTQCDAVSWAFDYYTGARVHMRAGYYVISKGIETPGGTGVAVFADDAGARRALQEFGGEGPLDFDQAQDRL